MAVLTVMTGAFMYMVTYEGRSVGPQKEDADLSALADAGVDRAYRAIRDDYATTTQTGTADLRGGDTALSSSVTNPGNMYYIDNTSATFTTGTAILRAFDANYVNTRIISIVLWARASRSTGSGQNNLVVQYTVDGASYNAAITTANLTPTLTNYFYNITADRTWTWAILMSPNFRVRATRAGTGSRTVNLDALWLTVTYSIDTLTEPWATGSYASFPITLGSGTIQSVSIADEAGKVHLNYANTALLTNLLTNLGIASASTKAANIVTYRGAALTNPFDSVEELQQVTGITASDYSTIKDYATVYSYINPYVFRPPAYVAGSPGARVPVNINTASQTVLKSVFDSSGLGVGDANTLANSIITQRTASPFVGFYSSTSASNNYFYNFVQNLPSGTFSAAEKNKILDTADPSALIPVSGATAFDCPTTELCYAGTAFYINSLGRIGTRNIRVKTMRNSASGSTFSTYVGDATSAGWRKENFE